ncbi:MAG TPA: type II CAAX endopeptidase family protein [Pyrinomonadaceae bacterium]|nr:type II CAAX endopeptidase family protein [Pyrinomonadaceae bacterium]
MKPRTIFFDDTNRLRSGWRFLVFCTVFFVAVLITGTVGIAALQAIDPSLVEPPATAITIVSGALMLTSALFAGWFCGRFLERLPFRALGAWFTEGWLRHLVLGIVFGALTLGLAVAIGIAFGGLRFETNGVDTSALGRSLAVSFLIFAVGAAWEEALFRGYMLQTFTRSGLASVAIGLTAVFFGLIHKDNDNATNVSIINTILAGVWFGIGYLKTRDLWFVWGMHLMWNLMQGAFFGIEVSGTTHFAPAPLLKEIDSGPIWLTGESYGVEGGIVTTIAITVSTLAIIFVPWLRAGKEMKELTDPRRHESEPGAVATGSPVSDSTT